MGPDLPDVAGVAHLVEHQPSKLRVAGSSPVSRSTPSFTFLVLGYKKYMGRFSVVERDHTGVRYSRGI